MNLANIEYQDKLRQYVLQMRPVFKPNALFSDETSNYVTPMEPDPGDIVTIRFRTWKDNVDKVYLVSNDRHLAMEYEKSEGDFDYFKIRLVMQEESVRYFFEIHAGKIRCFYNKIGVSRDRLDVYDFTIAPGFHTPEWAKGAVMYQIFVDRFCNGDPTNSVLTDEYSYIGEHCEQVHDWSKTPAVMGVREFYGGDLKGIMDKLDYLQDLGVEVVYLNPIFVSPSNHKYDTQDYDYIDPHYTVIKEDGGDLLPPGELDNTKATKYIKRVVSKENLEAIAFLQRLNEAIFAEVPEVMMIAEESTAWPMVTKPTYMGGLGFNYKWNMGWMNDMLRYMSLDPLFRKGNHNSLTFSFFYAFSENFILPISHDEVVYGKGSLYNKMPGTPEQKAAGVRCFATYMMAHPGKKLQFMGTEFSQHDEWNFNEELEWNLLQYPEHQMAQTFFKKLNAFYLGRSELWEIDFSWEGFSWISNDDDSQSVIAFRRFDREGNELIVVCNFLPVRRENYCIGVPYAGVYEEVFTSDAAEFGGTGFTNGSNIRTADEAMHGFEQSISLTLPENTVFFLRCKRKAAKKPAAKTTKTTAKKPAAKKAAGTKAAKKKA